jgi:putative transposase
VLTGAIKEELEKDIKTLCKWKQVEVLELSVQADHINLVCSIPPKLSISNFMGFLKGKLAIKPFKSYPGLRKKPYWGNKFWARGYFIKTVGMNEDLIRRYVAYQEEKEKEEERNRQSFLFESYSLNLPLLGVVV